LSKVLQKKLGLRIQQRAEHPLDVVVIEQNRHQTRLEIALLTPVINDEAIRSDRAGYIGPLHGDAQHLGPEAAREQWPIGFTARGVHTGE
jgi:hypothetical protein